MPRWSETLWKIVTLFEAWDVDISGYRHFGFHWKLLSAHHFLSCVPPHLALLLHRLHSFYILIYPQFCGWHILTCSLLNTFPSYVPNLLAVLILFNVRKTHLIKGMRLVNKESWRWFPQIVLLNDGCIMITILMTFGNVSGMVTHYSLIFHYLFISSKEIQKLLHASQSLLRKKSPSLSTHIYQNPKQSHMASEQVILFSLAIRLSPYISLGETLVRKCKAT